MHLEALLDPFIFFWNSEEADVFVSSGSSGAAHNHTQNHC